MIGSFLKRINHLYRPQYNYFSPEWMVLGVNNICNLHCKMCDVGTQNYDTVFAQNLVGTHPINMPLELIERIIDQTATFYPKAKLAYTFTEPLIYPHLATSLAYAHEKGLYTTMTTNALTLRQQAEKLVNAGLNEVFISLDGTADIHNEIRGNKKSFEKAVEGIQALCEYEKKPKIMLIYAITEWNIECMLDFLEIFKAYPIGTVAFMHTQYTDNEVAITHNKKYGDTYPATMSNLDKLDFHKMNLPKLFENIQYIRKHSYPFHIFFSPELNSMKELELFYYQPDKIFGKYCTDVFTNMMLKSDGSVIPSHGRCYNVSVGNIYKNSLVEIWNSTAFSRLRKDIVHAGGYFEACSRCCSAFSGYKSHS
jgi:MoaA/NifB/PqqE/SkfB family radical SAM enzyme